MIILRIAGIVENSVVDGPGIRYTIFTQGCPHHCKGCHNPDTWDPNGGKLLSIESIKKDITRCSYQIDGITISGGEPLMQAESLFKLVYWFRTEYMDKNIMLYTGYRIEEIFYNVLENDPITKLIDAVDYLVDGPYIERLRDLNLKWRGSSNQRLLLCPISLGIGNMTDPKNYIRINL